MIEILRPDFEFEDDRGKLVQLVNKGFKQVNVIETKAGVTRGNHYHKINKEAFYIIDGNIELTLKKNSDKHIYKFNKGDMFLINEYVNHEFYFLSDTVLVSMYNNGVELDNGEKDIYT